MNCHHLSIEERSCIRKYYVDGLSYREIAQLVVRDVSMISREIRQLYAYIRYPNLISTHSTKEVSAAALLLPPWDVPFTGSDRVHK